MELGLKGKTVIITGGGSNIGRSISLAFAEEGCNVVIAEIDEEQGAKVAKLCEGKGAPKAMVVKTDVTDWDSVQALVKKTVDTFGKIDVLVNNVGWTRDELFIKKPREEWDREIKLNFWSVINCIRAALDPMMEQKSGVVVNIASDAGRMGEWREAVYGGCKGGVIALTKALTREITPRFGIRFNTICPGATIPEDREEETGKQSIWTPGSWVDDLGMASPEIIEKMAKAYPTRRIGRPRYIATAAVFMASDASENIAGQTLSVSGGYSMM